MKLKIFFLLMFFTSLQAYSQKFRLGMKTSLNVCYVRSEISEVDPKGLKPGFSYGALIDYNFTDRYAFASEVSVSTIPNTIRFPKAIYLGSNPIVALPNLEYRYNIQYLQVPLTLKMRTNEIGYITYFGQFGFEPSFLLKSKADIRSYTNLLTADDVNTNDMNYPLTINDDINFIRMSMVVGAGIEYSIAGRTALLLGLKYDNGFTDMLDDKTLKAKNSYVALNVGVMF